MERRKVEYVLFDLDGVMIDSESIFTIAANASLNKYGKELTKSVKAGCMGKSDVESAIHIISSFPDIGLTLEEFTSERDRIQRAMWPTLELLPGVRKLVLHLKKHNVPIAIATSSRRHKMELKTAHLQDVMSCFEGKIVCGDDEEYNMKGKPAPDIFLIAAAILGRDVGKPLDAVPISMNQVEQRAKGLVFEDALAGIQAGKRAGMSVVWIPDSDLFPVDSRLHTLDNGGITERPDQILNTMEEFVPEAWGLPPYDRDF